MNIKTQFVEKNSFPFVAFQINGEDYCIASNVVSQMIILTDLKPMPKNPAYLSGILNVRGVVYSVIDLRVLFEIESDMPVTKGMVILIELNDSHIGLSVDTVTSIEDFEGCAVDNTSLQFSNNKYIKNVIIASSDKLFLEIDYNVLLDLQENFNL